jgi:kinesin family protein 5
MSWRLLFKDLFPLRHSWAAMQGRDSAEQLPSHDDGSEAASGDRFRINVYTRFKPNPNAHLDDHDALSNKVVLPLHQRLALIKMSHGLRTNRDALQVLRNEGSWFGSQWAEIDRRNGTSRKPSAGKAATPLVAGVQSLDPASGRVVVVTPDVGMREFAFDGVLPADISQSEVYNKVALRLVTDFVNGFNTTAIVYGQTGSGKTYTMFGPDGVIPTSARAVQSRDYDIGSRGHRDSGIVYRVCEEVLEAVGHRATIGIESTVGVSYVEIFGDTVSDLLRNGARCGHSKVAAQRFVLNGAAEREVRSLTEILQLLAVGEEQKRRAATMMNERSSRAHSVLILSLKQRDVRSGVVKESKAFLADLGGSEKVKKSQADTPSGQMVMVQPAAAADENARPNINISSDIDASANEQPQFSTGFQLADRMREAVYINLGLLALKKCIESLNNQSDYVPYKDSKLTMLLSSGLGGNSKTSVIVCGSMEPVHAAETLSSLRFGESCALVQTEARSGASMLAGVLQAIDKEIADLEQIIVKNERWVERREERKDAFAEPGTFEAAAGGVETKKVYVVTGAEKERQRLEQLLARRAELTGSDFRLDASKQVKVFGRNYAGQFGEAYDANSDLAARNERFEAAVDVSRLPKVLLQRLQSGKKTREQRPSSSTEADGSDAAVTKPAAAAVVTGWRSEIPADLAKLQRKALTAKRNKLRYSGLSL